MEPRLLSIKEYFKIKGYDIKRTQKEYPAYYIKGFNKPTYKSLSVTCCRKTAFVLYYPQMILNNNDDVTIEYHYVLLYPFSYYKKGVWVEEDPRLTFETWIKEFVECELANFYSEPIPVFKEAVIFNHI